MASKKLPFFAENSVPVAQRVAMGLQKIGLALKHQTWQQAALDGLSPTQGQIVALLSMQTLTPSEVAARIGVSLPTISDAVRVLVEKGLLHKEPDPRHPRASLLSLTSGGRKIAARVSDWPDFLVSAVNAMSSEEQTVFLSGLSKMIRALQEAGQIPVNRMCITCKFFRPHVHSGKAPHHCDLVDAELATEHLRLDCAEHEAAAPDVERANFERFASIS
ncbi:MAG: MarR family winged helix-turn-helix transcriptional regulator [Myxococcota bacterium]